MPQHTVLIVDDDRVFRDAAAVTLADAGYQVASAETPAAAEAILQHTPCALVIVDIQMQGNTKLEWLVELAARWPRLPVVLCTGYPTLETAVEAVRLPVRAYLVKPVDADKLVHEIGRVIAEHASDNASPIMSLATSWGLTPREIEVFEELAAGVANKQIAEKLACSLRTVELHVSTVLRKSNARSRAELLALLVQRVSS